MLELLAKRICIRLETHRLVLEPMEHRHAEAMFLPLQNAAIYQWISMEPPASLDQLRDRARRIASRMSPDKLEAWPNWAVIEKDSGAVMGEINASVDLQSICTGFGYYFFPAYWGKGFATEAVIAGTEHLASCGIGKLTATVTVGNVASERVLEKAGFRRARLLPGNDILRGVPVDDWEFVRD